jgi:hypothetical protein
MNEKAESTPRSLRTLRWLLRICTTVWLFALLAFAIYTVSGIAALWKPRGEPEGWVLVFVAVVAWYWFWATLAYALVMSGLLIVRAVIRRRARLEEPPSTQS